jgi:hypothetical protein
MKIKAVMLNSFQHPKSGVRMSFSFAVQRTGAITQRNDPRKHKNANTLNHSLHTCAGNQFGFLSHYRRMHLYWSQHEKA